jgi:1-acyl-sn-glycerol-3-phosphate acyltransferase
VVPVAHNAGEFWPRNAFFKRPGEVVVSVGPVIDTTGLTAEEINARAEAWVEGEMRRLFPIITARRAARKPARRDGDACGGPRDCPGRAAGFLQLAAERPQDARSAH